MEALHVASRVVFPMALLILLGILVRKAGVIGRPAMEEVNHLAFRVFMPATLFKNVYEAQLGQSIAGNEILFALVCLCVIFLIALFVPPLLIKDPRQSASVGQGIVRSNYILFGIAVADAIYGEGNSACVALLGAVVVPVTSAMAVVTLERGKNRGSGLGHLLLSILKNPIIIAALCAIACRLVHFEIPALIYSVVKSVAGVTTTVCFISLGVGLNFSQLRENRRPLLLGILFRLVIIPLIFVPLSVAFGFRGPQLCALLVLFCAPVAVSSYPMAVSMGADGPLSGQLVFTTTVLSIATIFLATFLLSLFGWL